MGSKKPKLPSGTWVERELFNSKAFWALKGAAPQLLIRFLGKRRSPQVKDKKGQKINTWVNLNSITMTYVELERLWYHEWKTYKPGEAKGLTQPRITRSLDELLAKGFIEIINPGGAFKQDKAVYGLIDKWKTWTEGVIYARRPKNVHRGYQGRNKTID